MGWKLPVPLGIAVAAGIAACSGDCSVGCSMCAKGSGAEETEAAPPVPSAPNPPENAPIQALPAATAPADAAPEALDAGPDVADAGSDAAGSQDAAPRAELAVAPTPEREASQLARCCQTFAGLVHRTPGQEAVGFQDLASACNETLNDVRRGQEPHVSIADREAIHTLLADRRVSPACRGIMMRFLP